MLETIGSAEEPAISCHKSSGGLARLSTWEQFGTDWDVRNSSSWPAPSAWIGMNVDRRSILASSVASGIKLNLLP